MSNVGLRPRHSELTPSFLAILRNPSRVELNVLRCVSSTAHSDAAVAAEAASILVPVELIMQNWALLLTQKTSRQQAVTPRFGGRLLNEVGVEEAAKERTAERDEGVGCDCRRTRTTSRGVTVCTQ